MVSTSGTASSAATRALAAALALALMFWSSIGNHSGLHLFSRSPPPVAASGHVGP
jgi:hypothetical protein